MVLASWRVNIIDIAPRTGYRSGEANIFHFTQVKWKRILPLSNSSNLLIQTMSDENRTLLLPDIKRVELERRMILVEANAPVTTIYFPEGGIASIVATSQNGEQTEVGIFGREGFSAGSLLLGSEQMPHQTFMQIDAPTALSIGARQLRRATQKSRTLLDLLLRYINTFMLQTACSVVSNAHNSIETRLARWLLMCHDRTDGDDIHLTHEFMAMMIAAQRSGVTLTLHILEGYGAIKASRGKVTITDRLRLEKTAGDSYGEPEKMYRQTIAPFGK